MKAYWRAVAHAIPVTLAVVFVAWLAAMGFFWFMWKLALVILK